MYTALIVDDETAVLTTLQTNISWQQFGVSFIYTASDGEQALDILKKKKIDLLITDIKMPRMDGLTLINIVRKDYPQIRCILLTAYSEFEYAKEAIRLGVENYLLKPFQQDELEETIEQALNNVYALRDNSNHIFRDNIFYRWLTGSINIDELNERSELLNINTFFQNYCVVLIEKTNTKISASSYISHCMNFLQNKYEVHMYKDDNRTFLIVGGNNIIISDLKAVLINALTDMDIPNSFLIAIGAIVDSSENLSQSYHSACDMVCTANITDILASASKDTFVLTPSVNTYLRDEILIQNLHEIFNDTNNEHREKHYTSLIQQLIYEETNSKDMLLHLAQCMIALFNQDFPTKPSIQKKIYTNIHLLSTTLTTEQEKHAVELLEYGYLMYRYYYEQLSPVVQLSIDYIQTHYNNSLSIKEFCTLNKMSTAYLGFLFKKETGMYFNKYLNQCRICAAIQLLLTTDKSINDISAAVGFSTPSYFIVCFKKQTGLSPIKYRSIHFDKLK